MRMTSGRIMACLRTLGATRSQVLLHQRCGFGSLHACVHAAGVGEGLRRPIGFETDVCAPLLWHRHKRAARHRSCAYRTCLCCSQIRSADRPYLRLSLVPPPIVEAECRLGGDVSSLKNQAAAASAALHGCWGWGQKAGAPSGSLNLAHVQAPPPDTHE